MDRVYQLFSNLYGNDLHDFLLGMNGTNETNQFNAMFIVLLIVSAGLIPYIYYKLIDRPTWNTFGKWFMVFLLNAIIIFFLKIAWLKCLDSQMVDEDGEALSINVINILSFGLASAIIASIVFFLASCLWKRFSTNCPNRPF